MKKEKSCGALVTRENGKTEILLLKHVNGGHFSFPKGHVEKGESEEETALREIYEESGLTVELDTGFRHVVTYSPAPDVIKDVVYFRAVTDNDKLHIQQEEITEAVWVPLESAEQILSF